MSVKGTSFNGGTDGALINFDVGNAANIFTGAFTIVCLAKFTSTNWGMLGGYSDAVGSTSQGAFFVSNNSGGRLYSNSDFTNGYPDPGTVASPGLSDDTWRWMAITKPAGSAHYRYHYADLATLTWSHGESASSANHGDASAVVVFSTWSYYAMGNGSGDMAALAGFTSELSDASLEAALTQAAADLVAASPTIGWLFPAATAGSAVSDFTGGGGDETSRQSITTSTDPADFDFNIGTDATINAGTIAAVASLPAATAGAGSTVSPAAIVASTTMPAGAVSTGATVTPAVVAAVAATPAAGVRTGSTVSPAAVAAVASLPAGAVSTGSTVSPAAIIASTTMPAATASGIANASISPSTIAAVAALPAPSISAGAGTVYARLGGVLVTCALRGAVRVNGSSVAIG